MSLIKGHSGLISPINLTTNGSFLINEFVRLPATDPNYVPNNAWVRRIAGQYVCDCWYVHSATTVDYLETYRETVGALSVRGYGKKGQIISIRNRDRSQSGQMLYGHPYREMTAAVKAALNPLGGAALCDLIVSVYPRADHPAETVFSKPIYLRSNGTYSLYHNEMQGQAVMCVKTQAAYDIEPAIVVELVQDGEFSVVFSGFQETIGAYANPPLTSPVHLSEDLARCQRYFQTGVSRFNGKATQYNTDHAIASMEVQFATQMAGTPTVSMLLDLCCVQAYSGSGGTASERIGQYLLNTRHVNAGATDGSSFSLGIYWSEATYAAQMYTNGVAVVGAWKAIVA